MRSKLFFIVAFTLLSLFNLNDLNNSNDVILLDDSNFEETVKNNKFMLVNFYLPDCSMYRLFLKSKFFESAAELKADNVVFASIDCSVNLVSKQKYAITSYPTILFFVNGHWSKYTGGNHKLEMGRLIRKKIHDITTEFKSLTEALTKVKKSNKNYALHIGNEGLSSYLDFIKLIEIRDLLYAHSFNEELINNFEDGSVLLLRSFDSEHKLLKKGYSMSELRDFLDINTIKPIEIFNTRSAEILFERKLPALILFYSEKIGKPHNYNEILTEVASKVDIQILINEKKQIFPYWFIELFGITDLQMPGIAIVDSRQKNLKKYLMKGEFTAGNVIEFYQNWKDGKLQKYVISEEIPINNKGSVFTLVGNNFEEIAYDESRDVLVMFFDQYCNYCETVFSNLEKVALELKQNDTIVIARMNLKLNENDKVIVDNYPTLILFPQSNKNQIRFEGENMSYEAIIAFLQHNAQSLRKNDL